MMKEQKESKVGKKLSDYTTRKVIILVLAMLFSVPVLSVNQYLEEPEGYDYGLELIKALKVDNPGGIQAFDDMANLNRELETPIIYLFANFSCIIGEKTGDETDLNLCDEPVAADAVVDQPDAPADDPARRLQDDVVTCEELKAKPKAKQIPDSISWDIAYSCKIDEKVYKVRTVYWADEKLREEMVATANSSFDGIETASLYINHKLRTNEMQIASPVLSDEDFKY